MQDNLKELYKVIKSRKKSDPDTSYAANLFHQGRHKIAQKVGEEAVELVIFAFREAKAGGIMVLKVPAATNGDLALALKELFAADNVIIIIGTRHGEKTRNLNYQ